MLAILLKVLMWLGIGIGAVAAGYGVYMLVIAVVPMKSVPAQRRTGPAPKRKRERLGPREDVSFEVKGTRLSAWFYRPGTGSAPYPCIVMAHGLGGTRGLGLDDYAVRFQQAGFAVLAFDYRFLGDSAGEPRQLVWIPHQLEDWRAAIAYARGRTEVDTDRVGLWGSSLSGGHVVRLASEDARLGCVSAQVPLLRHSHGNSGELVRRLGGYGYIMKLGLVHALRDMVRGWLGLSPHRLPLIGRPGTMAAMADAGAWKLLEELAPDDFVNEVCARILLRMDKYAPISRSATIRCPVLLGIADKDIATTPPEVVRDAEQRLGSLAETKHYPIDHFDIYLGEWFEKAVADQTEFFRKYLARAVVS